MHDFLISCVAKNARQQLGDPTYLEDQLDIIAKAAAVCALENTKTAKQTMGDPIAKKNGETCLPKVPYVHGVAGHGLTYHRDPTRVSRPS